MHFHERFEFYQLKIESGHKNDRHLRPIYLCKDNGVFMTQSMLSMLDGDLIELDFDRIEREKMSSSPH